jgi:glycosyltransferase involved in cell wall biosynthesis
MYGLPVVCTDSGGIRDFVNESNGIVVPLRDFQLFSDAIKEMILNVDKYDFKTMSEAIRKKYGKEAFTRKLLTEYHIALQK